MKAIFSCTLFASVVAFTPVFAGLGNCGSCTVWSCQEPLTIKQVQQALQSKGENVKPDGSFGPATQVAVKNFAEKNGLTNFEPTNQVLLRRLFAESDFEIVRRRILSAWVC